MARGSGHMNVGVYQACRAATRPGKPGIGLFAAQLTFARHTFMSVGGALDPVLLLDTLERHQPGDDIGSARHIGVVAAGGEDHPLTD